MLTLTQNVNFTLLFAILHEIPITPQDLLSSWEMLLHNDFLGQNWYFKARTDAVFFEKSCLKIQFLSENQLLSGNVLFFTLHPYNNFFLAQTDSTQLDHNFPMSWGNFRYLRFSGRFPSRCSAGHFMAPIAQNDPFWDRKMHFLSEIHFLEESSNFFVTIMTGYQNNNLFVSTTLLDGLLGGR